MIYLIFYNVLVRLMGAGIFLAGMANRKARHWVQGRNGWRQRLAQQLKSKPVAPAQPVVWMHASSLGEFEQGRPLLEKLRQHNPPPYIVVSFFSPSGYLVQQHYAGADIVCYLPLDTEANARYFIDLIKPALVLWIKYEYWYHHLHTLHQRKIAVLLVSGIFLPRQPFFHWYGALHRKMLGFFTHFFLQNSSSATLLSPFVPQQKISVCGDSRFDRVWAIRQQWTPLTTVEKWLNGAERTVVAGSTWAEDEKELAHLINTYEQVKWIIAPHQISEAVIAACRQRFANSICLSALELMAANGDGHHHVLIIDNIGMLSRLYRYGQICYVGGGFSATGVHNVLEAAVYGRPVIFGPEYKDYAEAVGLVEAGGAFVAETALQTEATFEKLWRDPALYLQAAKAAEAYVAKNIGATESIEQYIYKNRLLTN